MLTLLCAMVQGAWADTYDYPEKTKPEFYASYGGKSNVVVINTAAELAYITANFSEDSGYKVDGKSKDWSELNYYLNADINMGNSYSWMPLGRESYWVTKYEGTFWGNGHTITYMIRGLDEENQGLFSTIHKNGKVYDVNVVCNIYTKRSFVGGIAGQNYGLIQNCTVNADITMEDHQFAGGIVGENVDTGTITGCHVTGTIKGVISDGGITSDIGGIAGLNNEDIDGAGHLYLGTIVNCWVEADVISEGYDSYKQAELGGICGVNYATIKYCCVTGEVNSTKVKGYVGGIAGESKYDVKHCTFYGSLPNYKSEHNSKYVGNVSKDDSGPNLFDTFNQAEYDDAVSKGHALYAYAILNVFALSVTTTGTGTVTVSDFNAETIDYDKVPTGHWIRVNITSGVVSSFIVKDADGNDVEVTRYHQYGDNYYMFPMPRSNVSVTVNFTTQQGDGSEENPYIISTAEDWEAFAKNVNDNHKSYEGEYVMLDGDFEVSTFQCLGNNIGFSNAFKGTFDGNGHTLTCVYPPFTRVMDATIKNLHVIGNATGSWTSGSIVALSKGTLNLINCRSSVNVDCGNSQSYGGLVGTMVTDATYVVSPNANSVTIEGCVFDGSITSTVENEYRATDCSGFVGDAGEGGTVVIRNSLLKPASVGTGILSNTFAKMGNNGTLTIENSYFVATDNLPANQGTQARTVSAGADVTLSGLGEAATTYGSNGITAYAHGISYGGTYYAGGGESVSLTLRHGSKTGYTFGGYTASAGTISGTTLTMPDADVTIGAAWTRFLDGTGTDDDPYVIGTTDEWNIFASSVNGGHTFSGEFVKLGTNVSVSEMAGISYDKAFEGIFDGDGHTLTFTKGTDAEPFAEEYCAPFRHVKNAVIGNLHVDGTIYTSAKKAAGFVGESHGALTLTGCRSSVNINSSIGNDGTHGGLVSTLSGENNTITIEGCVFDGSFATTNGTNNCGGFIGWPVYNRPVITNSLMAPASVDAGMLANTFSRWHTTYEPAITNCYYVAVDNLPANQGTEAVASATAPVNLGSLVEDYGMVKAYQNGILVGGTYYVAPATVTLADGSDNTAVITDADGYVANVTLAARTLYKDGAWNTLCLPFNVTLAGSPLEGAVARPLTEGGISGTTLNLTFGDAVTELVAGTPYIIKWDSGDNIVSPVFSGVTIDATMHPYDSGEVEGDQRVRFTGTYSSMEFGETDNSILLMGGENMLYYPTTGAGLGAQHAYFKIGGDGAKARRITGFSIDFGDSEATGIISAEANSSHSDWYTIHGVKLDGKPTRSGVYINGGRKVVIK